jgi:uncharacterized membrane protein YkoI
MRKWQMALLIVATLVCGPALAPAQPTLPTQEAAPGGKQEPRVAPEVKCWADWSDAAVIVRREALMPVERVNKIARDKHPGADIIKVTLCEEHGKFVYRLVLREKQGQLKSELLDARQQAGQ